MGVIIPIMIFSIPILAILSKSEMGHAIADAIRHNSGASGAGGSAAEVAELRAEVEHLRLTLEDLQHQVLENAERVDFAERLLSHGQPGGTHTGEPQ